MTRGSTTQRGPRGPASGKRTRGKVRSTSQVTENTSMTRSASASNATGDSHTDSFEIPARNPGHQDVHIDEILRPVGHGAYPPGWKPRNKRPRRDQERAAKRMKHLNGVAAGVEERKGRGPNKSEKLKPCLAKGEPPWPLYFNTIGQPISNLATTFSYYLGDEARHYQRFPLHEEWGEIHKASFEDLWENARKHYEFIGPEDPEREGVRLDCPIDLIIKNVRESVQAKVRSHRNKIKNDHYIPWLCATTQEGRKHEVERLSDTIPKDKWPELCRYFQDPDKVAESARNITNCNSETDRPYSTSGPINHARKWEELKELLKEKYNLDVGFFACHLSGYDPITGTGDYPNASSKKYLENVREEALVQGVDLSKQTDPHVLTPILNAVSGGHHGGYTRGMGNCPTRRQIEEYNLIQKAKRTSYVMGLEEQLTRLQEENKKLKENEGVHNPTPSSSPTSSADPSGIPLSSRGPSSTPTQYTVPSFGWHQPLPPWYHPTQYTIPVPSWPAPPPAPSFTALLNGDLNASSGGDNAGMREMFNAMARGGWNGFGGLSQANERGDSSEHGGST